MSSLLTHRSEAVNQVPAYKLTAPELTMDFPISQFICSKSQLSISHHKDLSLGPSWGQEEGIVQPTGRGQLLGRSLPGPAGSPGPAPKHHGKDPVPLVEDPSYCTPPPLKIHPFAKTALYIGKPFEPIIQL